MADDIDKIIESSEFLEWLEKEWNDAFCNMSIRETITQLGLTKQEAVEKFKKE